MKPFVYDMPAHRVIFERGSIARLPEEVKRLGASRALVVSTPAELRFAEAPAGSRRERPLEPRRHPAAGLLSFSGILFRSPPRPPSSAVGIPAPAP